MNFVVSIPALDGVTPIGPADTYSNTTYYQLARLWQYYRVVSLMVEYVTVATEFTGNGTANIWENNDAQATPPPAAAAIQTALQAGGISFPAWKNRKRMCTIPVPAQMNYSTGGGDGSKGSEFSNQGNVFCVHSGTKEGLKGTVNLHLTVKLYGSGSPNPPPKPVEVAPTRSLSAFDTWHNVNGTDDEKLVYLGSTYDARLQAIVFIRDNYMALAPVKPGSFMPKCELIYYSTTVEYPSPPLDHYHLVQKLTVARYAQPDWIIDASSSTLFNAPFNQPMSSIQVDTKNRFREPAEDNLLQQDLDELKEGIDALKLKGTPSNPEHVTGIVVACASSLPKEPNTLVTDQFDNLFKTVNDKLEPLATKLSEIESVVKAMQEPVNKSSNSLTSLAGCVETARVDSFDGPTTALIEPTTGTATCTTTYKYSDSTEDIVTSVLNYSSQ